MRATGIRHQPTAEELAELAPALRGGDKLLVLTPEPEEAALAAFAAAQRKRAVRVHGSHRATAPAASSGASGAQCARTAWHCMPLLA